MSITWGVFQILRVFPWFSLGFFEPFPWDLGNPRCAPSRRTTHRETPRIAILAVSRGVSPGKWSDPMMTQSLEKWQKYFKKKSIHDIISNLIMKISMMTEVIFGKVFNLENIFPELGGTSSTWETVFFFGLPTWEFQCCKIINTSGCQSPKDL